MAGQMIIRSMSAVCTSVTSQDVELDWRPREQAIRWSQIVAVDRTSAPTTLEIGLKRAGSFYILNAETPSAAARSVRMHGTVIAPGEFVPAARFRGATLNDVLELYACGEVLTD